LLELPHDTQRRIAAVIDGLASDPRGPGTRKLMGAEMLYRQRIGDYRVV
jgi:mRNA interferase RelE/StbE